MFRILITVKSSQTLKMLVAVRGTIRAVEYIRKMFKPAFEKTKRL